MWGKGGDASFRLPTDGLLIVAALPVRPVMVWCGVVWRGAMCCSVMQCGAVWCSVVQCGAARSSMVRIGAVWCSMMLCGSPCRDTVWCSKHWGLST